MDKKKLIEARNQALYDRIRAHYKVNLIKSTDASWGSQQVGDKVLIYHYKTKHPISAFTHELLHIDTQINGYRRIRAGVSLNKETHINLSRICSCLDNEFQHHKMFDQFLALGFPENEFYNDLDSGTAAYLDHTVSIPGQPLTSLCVDYMTLIAPGGEIDKAKYDELKKKFNEYDGGKYNKNFQEIDNIIADWKADVSFNAEPYIIRFFQNINAGQTWVTYENLDDISSKNFPGTGFFTDKPFTIQELAKAFGM